MKYRMKPVTVEAIVWDGNNQQEIKELAGSAAKTHYQYSALTPVCTLVLNTIDGQCSVAIGDYIVKFDSGDIVCVKPWNFVKMYEEAE